ncbi:MAG: oxidoreductase [Curvibacter sp.]|nr:oxidoreductase [Curvibacter sp.]
MTPALNALVHTLRHEADDILSLELRPLDGPEFPAFSAGAHIDLHLPNGLVRSYSLLNDPGERHRYVLGILKDRASRGGSRWVHEQLHVGQRITIGSPRNHFALHEEAAHSVLVAGGIGVTPILCMARRLKAIGRSFELLYFARSRRSAAFLDELQALGMPLHLHFDDECGGPPALRALLAERLGRSGVHAYACGPAVMLDAFEKDCAALGCADVHVERFTAAEVAAATDARDQYTVELRRSGQVLTVQPGQSLLAALKAVPVRLDTSCEEGVCGSCETRVLAGTPDHRDSVLSASEKAANQVMMVCVSGCRSERLVLDL